jgi:hypothetical protein
MSRDASVTIEWAGEERLFRLGMAELARLQEARDEGPYMTFSRLHSPNWKIEDMREVLRLGLIGGGMSEADASRLVKREMESPPFYNLPVAMKVMAAGFKGAPDEEAGLPKSRAPRANGSTASSGASSVSEHS